MLEGKSMSSNMAANTNHTTLLNNQSAIKYLPYVRLLSNFGCKIIFMCSVNFWQQQYQQDSNSSFKGSNGHVTSWCKVAYCEERPRVLERPNPNFLWYLILANTGNCSDSSPQTLHGRSVILFWHAGLRLVYGFD